jgi:hypothetical protein
MLVNPAFYGMSRPPGGLFTGMYRCKNTTGTQCFFTGTQICRTVQAFHWHALRPSGLRAGAMVVIILDTPEWTSEPAPERWAALPLVSSHGWTTKKLNSNDALPSTDDMYSWILNGPAPPDEPEDGEGSQKRKPRRLAPLRVSASMPNLPSQSDRNQNVGVVSWKQALSTLRLAKMKRKEDIDWRAGMVEHGRAAQLREHVREYLSTERVPTPQYAARRELPPLASKWKKIGSRKPTTGKEIFNQTLVEALQTKGDFSQDELDEIRVRDLKPDSFIKVGEEFFMPAALHQVPAAVPCVPTMPPASHGWQPEGAKKKLGDAYYFHEPGERVRTNIQTLDEWRRLGRRSRRKAEGRRGPSITQHEDP